MVTFKIEEKEERKNASTFRCRDNDDDSLSKKHFFLRIK